MLNQEDLKEMTREEDFDVEGITDTNSEKFRLFADRIAVLMDTELETLMSILYRLDIDEAKIKVALAPANLAPAHVALAMLIVERQKSRMESKATYRQEPIAGWDDF